MKRDRIKRKSLIALSLLLMMIVCITSSCGKKTADTPTPVENVGQYPAQPLPDYSQYSAYSAVLSLLGVDNVIALYKNSNCAFYRAGFSETDEPYLKEEDGKLLINASKTASLIGKTDENGWIEVKSGTKVGGLSVTVYDGKIAIVTEEDNKPDVFSDAYTLEYLGLVLSRADEADLKNAFIDLPSSVTNGTNTVYYTLPDINLGLQTNVYYSKLGDGTVKAGPSIVAGQGKSSGNYTLVRVFNRQQAISAQFMAFPVDVRGGVRVAAGTYGKADGTETLIATAACSGKGTFADTVRIFDTTGVIRAAFVPEGLSAPYVIIAGRFVSGSSDEYLAVASENLTGGKIKMNVYSFSDLSLKNSFEVTYDEGAGSENVTLGIRPGSGSDGIIMYFENTRKAFLLDPAAGSAGPIRIEIPESATGVFASAFDGGYAVTLKDTDNNLSYVARTASGTSLSLSNYNVGWRENRFYSSFAKNNPNGYVDNGTFHHVRVDLAAPILKGVTKTETAKSVLSGTNSTYKQWSVRFTEVSTFHNGYHMWEPCFTHRWNASNSTRTLSQTKDADGNLIYASVGRDNLPSNYLELGSSFYIGTYADGIVEMDKMRLFTLRSYLNGLANEFRGENAEPEKMVAVSPVHEQEINVDGSVGDYNVNMITGFREYMLDLYGSIENINKRFGTPFTSEDDFDAPRYDPKQDEPSACRGQWDTYGQSEFFNQWSLYTRTVVNKRIMEAYREALLAGFPPESINAHQIPEGDAVAGFLGQADTRLSPVEAVTVCGTAYGGTRYSVWYKKANNFLELANNAGHYNITLGEYGSLSSDPDECLAQLRYMFSHGVKFLHMIVPYEWESQEYKDSVKAEHTAIDNLQAENKPRTVNTGITKGLIGYSDGDFRFDIVQMSAIGDGDNIGTGLLKSVNSDGSWEGTVYLVPFHADIEVADVSVSGSAEAGFRTAEIKNLQCGDQVELTFAARSAGEAGGTVTVRAYNGGYLLEKSVVTYELGTVNTPYRYVLSNQLKLEDVTLEIVFETADGSAAEVSNLFCTAQYENIAHKYFGDLDSAPAKGGVTFDIIGR